MQSPAGPDGAAEIDLVVMRLDAAATLHDAGYQQAAGELVSEVIDLLGLTGPPPSPPPTVATAINDAIQTLLEVFPWTTAEEATELRTRAAGLLIAVRAACLPDPLSTEGLTVHPCESPSSAV